MSAFLGKIHFWLYNKILLHEELIKSIVALSKQKGYDCEELLDEIRLKYGEPVTGSLAENIDHSNIHGWLQERINSVEKRMAFLITGLLKKEIVTTEEIGRIFHQNGASAMKALDREDIKSEDLFQLIFDHMLEGMPCDHVNEVLESTEDTLVWKTTRCLHKDYWDEAGGDVDNFYYFRDNWINGFLNGTGFIYLRTNDGTNTIKRK